ncbi:MAG: 3-hydroxyacyl-CoA dehydrogenase NAD-binding domain-containing protein [Caulobacterales bacterium]|nr:3-hydroxyacyl-CoA dehydrogenase NAD-binding domain-containing protein [Caulobacterales bacterium]
MIAPGQIARVLVVGGGVMGEGVAQCFAEAGLRACIADIDEAARSRCRDQIADNLAMSAEHGVLGEPPAAILERVSTIAMDALGSALGASQLVIETVPELIDLKRDIFAMLDDAPDQTLIASNTSSFTISQLTAAMRTPERVVGLHFFNPAHLIPAVEVHSGARTAPAAIAAAAALMKRVGKEPLIVRKETPGFVINRLTGALSREIDHLLDEGVVEPHELDRALKASLGFRLAQIGPMEGEDFIGLDTDARVSRNLFPELSTRTEPSVQLLAKVEAGDLGVKTGRGWYDYGDADRADLLNARNRRLLEQRRLYDAARSGAAPSPASA